MAQQRSAVSLIAFCCAMVLVALQGALAASRTLQQVPAPAPAATAGSKPAVDGVFIVTAAMAKFTNATTLTLSGLQNTTQWVKYKPTVSAGSFEEGKFFSKSLAAPSGKWVDGPQGLLTGSSGANATSQIILALNAPIYDPKTNSATLAYKVISPSNQTALIASDGVVNSALGQVSSASAQPKNSTTSSSILESATPGLTLYNATLFVDVTNTASYTNKSGSGAGEKAGLIRIDLGGGGWYGDPYYYGWP